MWCGMDEGLLNDLLECSVCLERLDTSSRVLPCQHTFCLKCLKVIVESHKELRCPECRVLVEAKVEELPPNVLLMRILEGMRNSAPRRALAGAAQRSPRGHHAQPTVAAQAGQAGPAGRGEGKPPPHARALHDYLAQEPGDLSFKKGETILLHKRLDACWHQGECAGRTGVFPITYVKVLVPLPIPTALCKALYDFRMSAPDEEGCLAFDKGAVITVHRRVDENWAEGRLQQRVGIFPIAFVDLNQAARLLMNSPTLNRPVPPLPELARAGHSDHRHHAQHSHRYQPMSMSTPATPGSYQQLAAMSHSHPNYQQHAALAPQQISVPQHASPGPLPARGKHLEMIQLTNIHNKGGPPAAALGLHGVARIHEGCERLRAAKCEGYGDVGYQNVRAADTSDSSSSARTSAGSSGTPNTSSDTSSCDSAEPGPPSSPDDGPEPPAAGQPPPPPADVPGVVLALDESSTATNTSLNVSLPPAGRAEGEGEGEGEGAGEDDPCSSKGHDGALLTFGLGLQAALAPARARASPARPPREPAGGAGDKRHSLTPASHLGNNHSQNRHSAEILATSLLDHMPERERERPSSEREKERRRRRSRSNERPLPASYVALYPYRPQKPDELELKKGATYTVTERCRDGWFKGCSERSQRCGVFPGNYVAPKAALKPDKVVVPPAPAPAPAPAAAPAPLAPPRAPTPPANAQTVGYPWGAAGPGCQLGTPKSDKSKDRAKGDKSLSGGVSLMKRLAGMKRGKSPPGHGHGHGHGHGCGYSLDNPVFEDGPHPAPLPRPAHVRSGSCPVQLLGALPGGGGGGGGAAAGRLRPRDRPAAPPQHSDRGATDSPWQSQHRKSQSLDATAARRDRHHAPPAKERFRCIVPYPPNSEYELELKVDDIVVVHRKRGDGWYKGTLQRTGRTGLFPASFVQSAPLD